MCLDQCVATETHSSKTNIKGLEELPLVFGGVFNNKWGFAPLTPYT